MKLRPVYDYLEWPETSKQASNTHNFVWYKCPFFSPFWYSIICFTESVTLKFSHGSFYENEQYVL